MLVFNRVQRGICIVPSRYFHPDLASLSTCWNCGQLPGQLIAGLQVVRKKRERVKPLRARVGKCLDQWSSVLIFRFLFFPFWASDAGLF